MKYIIVPKAKISLLINEKYRKTTCDGDLILNENDVIYSPKLTGTFAERVAQLEGEILSLNETFKKL